MSSNATAKNMKPNTSELPSIQESVVTDLIVVLDSSGSMYLMGTEPIQSVNAFLTEQQTNTVDDDATFTYITFNTNTVMVVDNVKLSTVDAIDEKSYQPDGCTALNDAICGTINKTLKSDKSNHKVMLIITDGAENSSQTYSTSETREAIKNCQDNHDWKFIFLGANIDAFAEGYNINVSAAQCGKFDQGLSGDLLQMCRQTSSNIYDYRRARTDGSLDVPELVAAQSMVSTNSFSVDEQPAKKQAAVDTLFIHSMAPIPLKRANACSCERLFMLTRQI